MDDPDDPGDDGPARLILEGGKRVIRREGFRFWRPPTAADSNILHEFVFGKKKKTKKKTRARMKRSMDDLRNVGSCFRGGTGSAVR